jgi:hypothetical protein
MSWKLVETKPFIIFYFSLNDHPKVKNSGFLFYISSRTVLKNKGSTRRLKEEKNKFPGCDEEHHRGFQSGGQERDDPAAG